MIDYLKCDQESFVIFTDNASPALKIAPSFTCKTGVFIEDAVYNDGVVRITVVDNNMFQFETLQFYQNSTGTFVVTASSIGDDDYEPDAKQFTFQVIVYGSDHPYLTRHFFVYDYNKIIDELISPTSVAAYKGCWLVNGGGAINDNYGIFSGLSADGIFEGTRQTKVRITGKALVPGVYCFAMEITSQNTSVEQTFPEGVGQEYVIICIRKPGYCAGDLVVAVDAAYQPQNNRIVVKHHDTQWQTIAEHLSGQFGVDLTRSAVVDDYTYEYYFERIEATWTLYGRYYLTTGTPGDYYVLATAPAMQFEEMIIEVPPEHGWECNVSTNSIEIAGDTRYFVPDFGFFDLIGDHPVLGSIYQQQTLYTEQWPGWTLPPEYEYNGGYILYQFEGKWRITTAAMMDVDDLIVKPQTINGAVIPYAPPRNGDLALENFNINTISDVRLLYKDYALGFWYKYVFLRQIYPPDGNESRPPVVCHISAEKKEMASTLSKTASSGGNPVDRNDCFGSARTSEARTAKAEATVPADYSINRYGFLDSVYGNTGSVTFTSQYNKEYDVIGVDGGCRLHDASEGFIPNLYPWNTISESQSNSGLISAGADFALFFGSGPNPKANRQEYFTATMANITASATTAGTKVSTYRNNSEDTYGSTDAVSGNASAAALICTGYGDFCGSYKGDIVVAQQKKETFVGSCVIYEHYERDTYDGNGNFVSTEVIIHRSVTASHNRTKLTKAGNDIEQGETIVTRDGVATTYDDPTGSIYSGILVEADDIADFTEVALFERRQYTFSQQSTETTEEIS